MPSVAAQLNAEIKNDFALAKQTVQSTGHALTAILVDGVKCKVDGVKKPNTLFVGAGKGSVNLIMQAAGFTNLFADKEGSYACVDASEVIAANPDVLIIIEASWDSALNKIDYMHNHAGTSAKRSSSSRRTTLRSRFLPQLSAPATVRQLWTWSTPPST